MLIALQILPPQIPRDDIPSLATQGRTVTETMEIAGDALNEGRGKGRNVSPHLHYFPYLKAEMRIMNPLLSDKTEEHEEKDAPQTCHCESCGNTTTLIAAKKLLGKLYCPACISAARSKRRYRLTEVGQKQLRAEERKKKKEEETEEQRAKQQLKVEERRKKKMEEAEEQKKKKELALSLQKMIQDLQEAGPTPLELPGFPLNLKRNERIYFLAGQKTDKCLTVGLVLTNFRLFFGRPSRLLGIISCDYVYFGEKCLFALQSGLKPVKLSSVIANEDHHISLDIHFDNGKCIGFLIPIHSMLCDGHLITSSKLLGDLLTELVGRVNDPIDESVFSPTRERMSDDLKMSVWRRDGGHCARCGSREKLEYDHIIPVSKGGSNTLRNIELLCEACNRAKSNRIM